MARIQQLPASVVTKIAAGEVIERPASVVKELLENAIDAGATRLDIDLEQGGAELIRVVDDGHGIEPADLPLVFASHATSKLKDADDLFRIGTLGFRGEAMASIGGVAKVTVQSRAPGQSDGCEVRCDGGELSPARPWNGAPGTRVEVRHLFFNVPVRKGFLRATATELGHAVERVTQLALANPALHLVLRHNGRLVHEVPAAAALPDRVGLFFGQDVQRALIPVAGEHGAAALTGLVADPGCDRGTARHQYLFVNGRCVRDRGLGHALQEAFRGLLMTSRYAVGFLFLRLPPDQVDVNVHPTKAEVRFRDAGALHQLVQTAVKRALAGRDLAPGLRAPGPNGSPPPAGRPAGDIRPGGPDRSPRYEFAGAANDRDAGGGPAAWSGPPPRYELARQTVAPWERPAPAPPGPPAGPGPAAGDGGGPPGPAAASPVRALQIHDAYLVVETPDGMLVVDQHALHERILYEQLRRRVREGKLEAQRLLIPEPVELTMEQAGAVLEARPQLAELGLDVQDFGGGTVAVSSYPALLGRVPVGRVFQGVVDVLATGDRPPTRDQLSDHLLATMACKAAVKAGDRLTAEEIDYLMRLRPTVEDSHHCPHGRPTSLVFSRKELDKQFRRT